MMFLNDFSDILIVKLEVGGIGVMKAFLKDNKLISAVFCGSILVIFAYVLSLDVPEWFTHAGDWFNILFQLAIGFVINFMFYVTQVYIPRIKQLKQANDCIFKRIEKIESYMNEMFEHIACKYVADYAINRILTDEQFVIIMQKLDFDDEINVVNANRANMSNCYFTVKEWLRSRMEFIEHDIDKLYSYYAAYISPELMNVLEKILKSAMHQNMGRTFFQLPQKISFKECNKDIFFEPYYKLMKELREVKAQYKQ